MSEGSEWGQEVEILCICYNHIILRGAPLTIFESTGKSFREEQCEKYNTDRYLDIQGNMKQWIPKYSGVSPRDRCKLVCRAKGSNEFKVFEAKVHIHWKCFLIWSAIMSNFSLFCVSACSKALLRRQMISFLDFPLATTHWYLYTPTKLSCMKYFPCCKMRNLSTLTLQFSYLLKLLSVPL